MDINELERGLGTPQSATRRDRERGTERRRERDQPRAPSRIPVKVGGQILPFFPVLLRGREPGAHGDHPSVGYARSIFVVIGLGWVIETLSFLYLGWTYSNTIGNDWIRGGLALLLGVAIATTLVFLGLLFVRKPLPPPKLTRGWKSSVPVVLAVLGMWGSAELGLSWWRTLLVGASGAGMFTLLALVFGWMESIFITSRVLLMVMAGVAVAIPLHEMMFMKEVSAEHFEQRSGETKEELAEIEKRIEEDCRSALDYERLGNGGQGPCQAEAGEHAIDDVNLEATDLLLDISRIKTKKRSNKDQSDVDAKLARAKEVGATEAIQVLTREHGFYYLRGQRSRLRNMRKEFKALSDASKARLDACKDEAHDFPQELNRCIANANDDDSLTRARARLIEELSAYESQQTELGVLELGIALDQVGRGGEGYTEEEEVEARRAVVRRRFLTPWFLALLVPLLVITLKLTAGAELEDYLYQRWGREIPKH